MTVNTIIRHKKNLSDPSYKEQCFHFINYQHWFNRISLIQKKVRMLKIKSGRSFLDRESSNGEGGVKLRVWDCECKMMLYLTSSWLLWHNNIYFKSLAILKNQHQVAYTLQGKVLKSRGMAMVAWWFSLMSYNEWHWYE